MFHVGLWPGLLGLLLVINVGGRARGDENGGLVPSTIPGGVVDPGVKRAFVVGVDGGIDAVNAADGQLLWHSDLASRPLLATVDRLIALQEGEEGKGLRVVVLEAGSGRRLLESEPVASPLGPGGAALSSYKAMISGDDLTISWEAGGRYLGGANAPPEVVARAEDRVRGVTEVDLKSGKIAPGRAADAPPALSPSGPIAHALETMEPAPFWSGRVGDDGFACLTLGEGEGGETLELTTWDGPRRATRKSKVLFRGRGVTPVVTEDGQHVLVRGEADGAPKKGEGEWSAFSMGTGATVSEEARLGPDCEEPTVRGDRLFSVRPGSGPALAKGGRTLNVTDLKTGKALWGHPIAGPAPRKPLPNARPRP